MEKIGRVMIVAGLALAVAGVLVWMAGDKLKFLGRLPGDVRYENAQVKVYIPITTMLLLSLLLSVVMWLVRKFS